MLEATDGYGNVFCLVFCFQAAWILNGAVIAEVLMEAGRGGDGLGGWGGGGSRILTSARRREPKSVVNVVTTNIKMAAMRATLLFHGLLIKRAVQGRTVSGNHDFGRAADGPSTRWTKAILTRVTRN